MVFTVCVHFVSTVLFTVCTGVCTVCNVHPDATEEEHCRVGQRELIGVDVVSSRIRPESPVHNNPPISPPRLLFAT